MLYACYSVNKNARSQTGNIKRCTQHAKRDANKTQIIEGERLFLSVESKSCHLKKIMHTQAHAFAGDPDSAVPISQFARTGVGWAQPGQLCRWARTAAPVRAQAQADPRLQRAGLPATAPGLRWRLAAAVAVLAPD
jgi:hypothetical protein